MAIDLSNIGCLSGQRYGVPLGELVCVYGFEKTLSSGQLIDFGFSTRPVMDCIEKLSIRQTAHSRMVLVFFINKYLTALVTDQDISSRLSFQGYLMICRSQSRCYHRLSKTKGCCLIGSVCVPISRPNSTSMQAVTTHWFGDDWKRLVMSSPSCADVTYSTVSRVIGAGCV